MALRVVSLRQLKLEVLLEPGRSGDSIAEVCRRRGGLTRYAAQSPLVRHLVSPLGLDETLGCPKPGKGALPLRLGATADFLAPRMRFTRYRRESPSCCVGVEGDDADVTATKIDPRFQLGDLRRGEAPPAARVRMHALARRRRIRGDSHVGQSRVHVHGP